MRLQIWRKMLKRQKLVWSLSCDRVKPPGNIFFIFCGMHVISIFKWACLLAFCLPFSAAVAEINFSPINASNNSGRKVALPVLTTAQAVRQLSIAEARKGYPVQLEAVVLACDVTRDGLMEAIVEEAKQLFPQPRPTPPPLSP